MFINGLSERQAPTAEKHGIVQKLRYIRRIEHGKKKEEKKQRFAHHLGDTHPLCCSAHQKGPWQGFCYQYHTLHHLLYSGHDTRLVDSNEVRH
jgi:hypothetical protein